MIHPAHVPLGIYLNHDSVLHRLGPGVKIVGLITFLIATAVFVDTLTWALGCVAVVALLYALAKIPPRIAFRQLIGAVPILVFIAAILWWRNGWPTALTTAFTLLSAIAAAILLTLTTRVGEMMDTLSRVLQPLARFGVPVDTLVLALSLTIRLIPLQVITVSEVLEARRARGAHNSILAFGVPVLVRSINRAKAVADALIARGHGD